MSSGQPEPGSVVVKARSRFECFKYMTVAAGFAQCGTVGIIMAGDTARGKTKVSERLLLQPCFGDVRRFMTVGATPFRMGSLQGVTRQVVVEFFLLETDELEVPPVMVAVTSNAFLAFHLGRGMIPLSSHHPHF